MDTNSDVLDGDTTSIAALLGNKGPDGFISLREAIIAANRTPNGGTPDSIKFNIGGGGVQTIVPLTALPIITQAVVVDGSTQPGAVCPAPVIELNGGKLFGSESGLVVASNDVTIRGLSIHTFPQYGIYLQKGTNSTVACTYVGLDAGGVANRGNGLQGIRIDNGPQLIGGTDPADRNVISGNSSGVYLQGTSAADVVIQGNYIGTNAAADAPIPNSLDGVRINGGPRARILDNVISGNSTGVSIRGHDAVIQGNLLGTDPTGMVDLGNVDGVNVGTGLRALIGGTTAAQRNVISGSGDAGVQIGGDSATVIGNYIGVAADGTTPMGNFRGIVILTGSEGNIIGGTGANEGNIIAHSLADGVNLYGATTMANPIRGNSIFLNGGLGIDLDPNGVTPNDVGDVDTGPHNLTNFPFFDKAEVNATAGTLELTGWARPASTIDVYIANADPTGFGEGETWLAALTEGDVTDLDASVTAYTHPQAGSDSTNRFRFVISTPPGVSAGTRLTATAHYAKYGTSEFSLIVDVAAAAGFVVDTNSDVLDGDTTSIAALVSNRGPDGFISLREAIIAANRTPNGAVPDSITFDIGGGGIQTITPLTALPTITDAVVIDGTSQPGFTTTPIIEISGATAGAVNGLTVSAGGSIIRGLVINRFATGIALTGGSGHLIAGNYLGPDVTGMAGNVGNSNQGIYIYQSTDNVIGGIGASERNVISGNRQRGIWINDFSDGAPATADGTRIFGNYIGPDAAGTGMLSYSGAAYQEIGVAIWDGPDNVIGGSGGQGNVISGNSWHGLYIWGPNASGNVVRGNIVGRDVSNSSPLGNGFDDASRAGVLFSNTPGNTVGGTAAGEANVIASNDSYGLVISSAGATGNVVSGNSIFDNVALGIDLAIPVGVTPNDVGDVDTGPNDLFNFPFIESVTLDTNTDTLEIVGFARAGSNIELFVADPDPSGFGEGQTYLVSLLEGGALDLDSGSGSYMHPQAGSDSTNRFRFRLANPGGLVIGTSLTATATDASSGTSEFSLVAQVAEPQALVLSAGADQTFWVGKAPTAISPILVGETGGAASITATNDIRIHIPAGFDMTWDTLDVAATIGGGASSKVSPTVSYEDAGATLVLDVTNDFAAGDTITVADLSFLDFTAASGPDNLELEIDDAGTVAAEDDKAIEILPGGTPTISSELDQSFRVGDPPNSISTITVRADAAAPTITAANDIRIRIPFGFNMTWDTSDLTALILGTAAAKVSNTVSYEDGGRTLLIDVLTDFDPGDLITIEDLSFVNFTAASLDDNLELEVGDDGQVSAVDDKVIFIVLILVTPDIHSSRDQYFTVGDPSTPMVAIRITDDDVIPQVTAANDIRITIPADLDMVWDVSDVTAQIGARASQKVSPTVSYEDGGKTLVLDVITDFVARDWISVRGLSFASFTSAGAASRLQLRVYNDASVVSIDSYIKQILGGVFSVDVWPDTVRDSRLPSNGSNYTVDFTVSNIGSTTDDYDLLTSEAPGTAITVTSITGPGVSQGANPDSARLAGLLAGESAVITVTYAAGLAPVGTIDTLSFVARSVTSPAQSDDGLLIFTVIRPNITISKVVNPSGTQAPGTDLSYTATLTNAGTEAAVGVSSVSSIASETQFKIGSVATSFPAGIVVAVDYSDDNGSTWTYTPVDQACSAPAGYDGCLTDIRWTLQNPLSASAPDNVGTMEYVARIK